MQPFQTETDPLLGDSIRSCQSLDSSMMSTASSASRSNQKRSRYYIYDPDDEELTIGNSSEDLFGSSTLTGKREYKIVYDETTLLKATVFIEDAAYYRSIHHKVDKFSLSLYRFYYSTYVQWFLYFVIFTIHVLAFFERPSSLRWSSDIRYDQKAFEPPCGVTESIEMFCLVVFLVDVVIKCSLVGRRQLFRSPWLIVYLIIVLASLVDWCITVGLLCSDVVRVRRMLRPFFLLQNSSLMKKTVNCLRRTVPDIFSVLMFLCLHLFIFTLCGMLLFPGTITKGASNITNSSGLRESKYDSERYMEGDLIFPNFPDAVINLLVLLTTANNPDVMMPAYRNNRLFAIYFILFLAIGMYCLMNMLTAVIYNQFRGYFLNSMQGSLFRRRLALRAAFEVLRKRKMGLSLQNSRVDITANGVPAKILKAVVQKANLKHVTKLSILEDLSTRMGCVLNAGQFQEALRHLDETQNNKQEPEIAWVIHPFLSKLQTIFSHRYFGAFGTFVALVNVICITVEVCTEYDNSFELDTSSLSFINMSFILFYLFEQGLKVWANGYKRYFWKKSNAFDFALTVILVIIEIIYMAMYGIPYWGIEKPDKFTIRFYDLVRLVNILIVARLLRIIPQIKMMSLVASTLADLARNLKSFAGVLSVVYYVFAILGMELFKGKIKYNGLNNTASNDTLPLYECGTYQQLDYWANNFDDFAASLVVLWDVMVQNNWYVFLHAYSKVVSKWSQLYFVVWWAVSVIITVNLFTALILENFIMRWDRLQQGRRDRERSMSESYSDSMNVITIHQMFRGMLQEPEESELLNELRYHEHLGLTEFS